MAIIWYLYADAEFKQNSKRSLEAQAVSFKHTKIQLEERIALLSRSKTELEDAVSKMRSSLESKNIRVVELESQCSSLETQSKQDTKRLKTELAQLASQVEYLQAQLHIANQRDPASGTGSRQQGQLAVNRLEARIADLQEQVGAEPCCYVGQPVM